AQADGGRVPGQLVDGQAVIGLERFRQHRIALLAVARVLTLRGPAADARDRAKAAVPHDVADAEHDRDVEALDPPAWHGLVVLGDVLIPVVTGFLLLRVARAAPGRPPEQPGH